MKHHRHVDLRIGALDRIRRRARVRDVQRGKRVHPRQVLTTRS